MRTRTRDKSEECLECKICKNNCPKDVRGVYGADCGVHQIADKFDGLNAHFCLQHNMYHCWKHKEYCKKVYGASVMAWRAPPPKEIREEGRRRVQEWDAESCRLYTWSDQIEFEIIKCAECKSTVCGCEYDGESLTVESRNHQYYIHVDIYGNRETEKIRDYSNYYDNIDKYQSEYQQVDEIILDHYQKTGYSLNRSEVLKKLRNGEIKIKKVEA